MLRSASALDDETAEPRLCAACIGEPFLKAIVRKEGKLAACNFCSRKGRSFAIEQIADRIEMAFEQHFERTSEQPDVMEELAIRHGHAEFNRHGDPVADAIAMAAGLDAEPAQVIADLLADRHDHYAPGDPDEEQDFGRSSYYERRRTIADDHFHADWERFERSLKSEVRFFSRFAQELLAGVFDEIEAIRTRKGASVVTPAGPGSKLTSLYRARVFQTQEQLEVALKRPDLEIGPPSSKLARSGRMNARGVPVFYGATEDRIALAEVRPPVGSDVVIARFDIVRPLRLLDVEALGAVFVDGSVFDPTLASRAGHALFLQTLSERITRAVMPDAEDFEYLVTQAMADYLADHPTLNLDGILFPSAQRRVGGANVVLFHKAARAKLFDLPQGTEIDAFLSSPSWAQEDGEDETPTKWKVTETTPAPGPAVASISEQSASSVLPSLAEVWFEADADPRAVSLKVDPSSLIVHKVTGVRFTTRQVEVERSRQSADIHDPF